MHVHSHCRASNQFVQNTSVGNVCLGGGELHVFNVGVQAAPMHLSPTNPLHDSSERRWQPRKGHSTVCGGFPLPRSASQSNRQLHSHTMHAATSGTSLLSPATLARVHQLGMVPGNSTSSEKLLFRTSSTSAIPLRHQLLCCCGRERRARAADEPCKIWAHVGRSQSCQLWCELNLNSVK